MWQRFCFKPISNASISYRANNPSGANCDSYICHRHMLAGNTGGRRYFAMLSHWRRAGSGFRRRR